jgi:hypothetical protein
MSSCAAGQAVVYADLRVDLAGELGIALGGENLLSVALRGPANKTWRTSGRLRRRAAGLSRLGHWAVPKPQRAPPKSRPQVQLANPRQGQTSGCPMPSTRTVR